MFLSFYCVFRLRKKLIQWCYQWNNVKLKRSVLPLFLSLISKPVLYKNIISKKSYPSIIQIIAHPITRCSFSYKKRTMIRKCSTAERWKPTFSLEIRALCFTFNNSWIIKLQKHSVYDREVFYNLDFTWNQFLGF